MKPDRLDKVFIDANIPMYAAGKDHPCKEPSIAFFDAVSDGKIYGVTSVEVMQEILHRFFSIKQREKALEIVNYLMLIATEVLPVTIDDVMLAVDLSRSHVREIPARDFVHVAVMLNNGIYTIISADRHFDLFPEIHRIDPMEFRAAE